MSIDWHGVETETGWKYPYINTDTGTWWQWSEDANAYVNTGINAIGYTGDTGPQGERGPKGDPGTSVFVTSITESSEDGGANIVTLSDGHTLTIRNGNTGSRGPAGRDGINGLPGADGETGPQGPKGERGTPGAGVTVIDVSESDVDGGTNIVTFSDGSVLGVKNGNTGSQGPRGYKGERGNPGQNYEITQDDYALIAEVVLSKVDDVVTQAIEDINDEKTGAISDIEDKGEEVLESIPDDYTQLSNDVSELKADLNSAKFTIGMKNALLTCFQKVAWINDDANDYYDLLYHVFNGDVLAVTNNLTNCQTSNNQMTISKGDSYTATLTSVSPSALALASVTVMMGNEDITDSVYSNGTISIAEVTDDLIITASVAEGYTLYDFISQVENISSNQSIMCDFGLSSDYIIQTKLYYTDKTVTSFQPVMGVRKTSSGVKEFALFIRPNDGKLGYWYDSTDTVTNIYVTASQITEITIQPVGINLEYPSNAVILLDDVAYNTTSTSTGVNWSNMFAFFGYSTGEGTSSSTYLLGSRLFETIIMTKQGAIIHDLIPASNGTYYGLYDVATDKFYANETYNKKYTCGNI